MVIIIQYFLLSVLPLLHVDHTHLELGLDEHLTKLHKLFLSLVSGVWCLMLSVWCLVTC